MILEDHADIIEAVGIEEVKVRSVLGCKPSMEFVLIVMVGIWLQVIQWELVNQLGLSLPNP